MASLELSPKEIIQFSPLCNLAWKNMAKLHIPNVTLFFGWLLQSFHFKQIIQWIVRNHFFLSATWWIRKRSQVTHLNNLLFSHRDFLWSFHLKKSSKKNIYIGNYNYVLRLALSNKIVLIIWTRSHKSIFKAKQMFFI